ncbi:MAG: hypothetical protein WC364_11905 [Eubacteriales bacterium]
MKKKLDKGKTPIIEDGYIHVGKVELQPAITYSTCLDCERLKRLCLDLWEWVGVAEIMKSELAELKARLKQEESL